MFKYFILISSLLSNACFAYCIKSTQDICVPSMSNEGENEPNGPIQVPYPPITGESEDLSDVFSMQNYFSNLKHNFARNYFGTCSFTALTMLLSYYDTFYNGVIIPDSYSSSQTTVSRLINSYFIPTSPGIIYENSNLGYTKDTRNLYFNATYSYLFDSKLIIENDYIHAVQADEYQPILDAYYGPNKLVMRSQPVIMNNSLLLDDIKRLIDNNTPVILNIEDESGRTRHAVVAYDYDAVNIYCHFGYANTSCRLPYNSTFGDTEYKFIYYYAYLDIESSYYAHSHCDRYIFNNLAYCGCGEHCHIFDYVYVSETTHKKVCPCGETIYERHTKSNLSCCNPIEPPDIEEM